MQKNKYTYKIVLYPFSHPHSLRRCFSSRFDEMWSWYLSHHTFRPPLLHGSWDILGDQTTDPSSLRLSALSFILKQLSRFPPVLLAACLMNAPTKSLELSRDGLWRILQAAPRQVKGVRKEKFGVRFGLRATSN